MPIGLTYLGLRCVLEHLDAVKRIHIASRSAVLQKSEKSIPIRLNYLYISNGVTCLDYCSMSFRDDKMELEFDDDRRKIPWTVLHSVPVPQNLDTQTVGDKINQYYMGGRSNVYVKRLKSNYFEDFLPIIDPISFPLKYLKTGTAGLHTYDHPVFRSAESLTFGLFEENSEAEMICLHKLPCKTILFEYNLEWINIANMIRYWMRNPKEIGTKYTFVEYDHKLVYSELMTIKREFEEIRHDLEGTRVNGCNYPSFLIPLNPTSKLLVYAIDSDGPYHNFIIKVVPESETDFTGIEGEMAQLSLDILD
ncbi:hypothetical protein GCK72_020813 [Caenorhabditis remanei]|uniref:F-box associated domain-containing protein n=1 Tax=Caenorhabditis remanei TaxID=31234 RepID=A0A6A5GHV5_CAERE|nr:hypothetical protein GCK72_020813 [Caenorhabditis remanei]KAF1754253.1 hypothetical protein GCK72_020813 [Caenorhabditis remanei]